MGAATQPLPFGKYVLLDRIATGGMAEIFKAKYRAEGGFEKTLVIKRILPHLSQDDDFITMFRDEAKLTVRLNHANIVQVFDFGRIERDYFLAMEYVQGQNLRSVMKRCGEMGGTVPIPFALFACSEICKGLNYAHTRHDPDTDQELGIVHRDVTPSNILVSYEGEVKLADFGIAKAASRGTGTQAGMIKGKASYLAPEQVLGRKVDARADLFALGAVLWELLVGRKLFSGDTDFEIMNKLTEAPILRPSEMNGAVPPEIDKIVLKALQRDPSQRYQNAGQFQKDLSVLMQQFGGNITTMDISAFLRRLFKKEVEAEREASKSLRMPVFDEAEISKAATDGATLANRNAGGSHSKSKPAKNLAAEEPAPKSSGRALPMLAIVFGLAVFLVFGLLAGKQIAEKHGWKLPFGPEPTVTQVAVKTAAPTRTPAPTETVAAATHTPAPTATANATPAPTATRVAVVHTPRPTPKPTNAIVASTPTPAPTAATSGGYGILKLDSDPWGEIYIDGKKIGRQTPAFDLRLPEGRHEVKLVNPIHNLGASFTVFVSPKEPTKMVVKLSPL